ncbi:MAG: VWA domain-containing protein [Deltaproteobacteria bacterium]|nr:VWA domain-containing protein [Deltaproteobacteria bacterium]
MWRIFFGLVAIVSLGFGTWSCGGSGESPINLGSDTDSGTDGDTDADSDTDSDADGDGDGDGDGDSDGDAGNTDTSQCATADYPIEHNPINMLVVLDRSLSMSKNKIGSDTYAKVVATALKTVVKTNDDIDLINFGLGVFPAPSCTSGDEDSPDECTPAQTGNNPVVPMGLSSYDDIAAQLDGIGTCGGTPLCQSLKWAMDYLTGGSLPADVKDFPGYVLVATDGAPNCNSAGDVATCLNTATGKKDAQIPNQCLDDMCSYNAAIKLHDKGIPVYVIGVGSSVGDWQDVMNKIAQYGGTTKYYPAGDATALNEALAKITGEALSCEFTVDWTKIPDDATPKVDKSCDKVRVYGTPKVGDPADIKFSPNCTDTNSWHWKNDPDEKTAPITDCTVIELCPGACQKLKDGAYTSVSAGFGCDIIPVG